MFCRIGLKAFSGFLDNEAITALRLLKAAASISAFLVLRISFCTSVSISTCLK